MTDQSLQDRYAPANSCFGCGPANAEGLQIKSFARGEEVIASWEPKPHHQAFPGVLNGGIVGTLLDCHCNWTACHHLMRERGAERPPCTVTANYTVRLKRPTPMNGAIELRAWAVESNGDRVSVDGELIADGKICATFSGTFVAVEPGHPAYHRW